MEDESLCDSSSSRCTSVENDASKQTATTTTMTTHMDSFINNEDSENSYVESDPLSPLVPVEQIYLTLEDGEHQEIKAEVTEEPLPEEHGLDFTMLRKKHRWRQRKPVYRFNRDEEEDLVEWYKENVFLYDKESKDHKNPFKKSRVLEDKGRSMNPPVSGNQIATWMETNRTRFGKLTTPKSGAPHTLSARDQWILEKFSFLRGHIRRLSSQRERVEKFFPFLIHSQKPQQKRKQKGYKGKTPNFTIYQQQQVAVGEPECELIHADDDDDGDSLMKTSLQPKPSPTTTTTTTANHTTTSPEETNQRANELTQKIVEQLSDTDSLITILKKLENKTPRERVVDAFYEYMSNMTMEMSPDLWREYTMKVMELGNHFMMLNENRGEVMEKVKL